MVLHRTSCGSRPSMHKSSSLLRFRSIISALLVVYVSSQNASSQTLALGLFQTAWKPPSARSKLRDESAWLQVGEKARALQSDVASKPRLPMIDRS